MPTQKFPPAIHPSRDMTEQLMHLTATPPAAPQDATDSLITYPCLFPIKVMGAQVDGFLETMMTVCREFDPDLDASTIEQRPSKSGNYLGLTLNVNTTSRVQLDALYRALSSHPMVKIVL
jgi:uncharacterized protein